MYAVIRTGGKQYKVQEGDRLLVEKLPGAAGDKVSFEEVLFIGGTERPLVGKPLVAGASVEGLITAQTKGDKVIVFKFKRRKGYKKKQGHRQQLTEVQITKVTAPKQ